MRVTKEEKNLHKFLKLAYDVFSKEDGRTLLFGDSGRLFFVTGHYIGVFKYETELIADGYEFKHKYYDLKANPDGSYYMQEYTTENPISVLEREHILHSVYDCIRESRFVAELKKDDGLKLSKIVSKSGLWLMDDDLKYIKQLGDVEVRDFNNWLDISNIDVAEDGRVKVEVNLIVSCEYNPLMTVVQEKMDVDVEAEEEEQLDELLEDTVEDEIKADVEEFEDDSDPMLD